MPTFAEEREEQQNPANRFREHPVHAIEKHVQEAIAHTYVRCSLHNHDRDALAEVRHHLTEVQRLAKDIITWHNDEKERERRRQGTP